MLILIPFLVIVLVIVAIDQIYYSDTKPKEMQETKRIVKEYKDIDKQKSYVEKYIKR